MISIPAFWAHHHGVHLVTLYPPGGGGRIRYYERLRLARASVLVARVLADDETFRATAVGAARPFLTDEGEHGLLVPMRGLRGSGRAHRSVAIVYTDEFAAALDTLVAAPEAAQTLELKSWQLMTQMQLGLGVRRRRFVYEPPPGWWAMASGLVATWHPPGYPREATSLTVSPAVPRPAFQWGETETHAAHAEMTAGLADATAIPAAADAGPVFERRSFSVTGRLQSGMAIARQLVTLFRKPYLYNFRLETAELGRLSERIALLERVVASAQPVPEPASRQFTIAGASSFGHWVD